MDGCRPLPLLAPPLTRCSRAASAGARGAWGGSREACLGSRLGTLVKPRGGAAGRPRGGAAGTDGGNGGDGVDTGRERGAVPITPPRPPPSFFSGVGELATGRTPIRRTGDGGLGGGTGEPRPTSTGAPPVNNDSSANSSGVEYRPLGAALLLLRRPAVCSASVASHVVGLEQVLEPLEAVRWSYGASLSQAVV